MIRLNEINEYFFFKYKKNLSYKNLKFKALIYDHMFH